MNAEAKLKINIVRSTITFLDDSMSTYLSSRTLTVGEMSAIAEFNMYVSGVMSKYINNLSENN